MSEQKIIPMSFNRDADLLGDLDQKLASFLAGDTPYTKFIGNEVEVVGAYIHESLLPQPEELCTIFIGKWIRHRDERLYVRANYHGTVPRIVLAQEHQTISQGIPIWSHVCNSASPNGKFFLHSPNYGLSLYDISRATELIKEFESALRAYGTIKS